MQVSNLPTAMKRPSAAALRARKVEDPKGGAGKQFSSQKALAAQEAKSSEGGVSKGAANSKGVGLSGQEALALRKQFS